VPVGELKQTGGQKNLREYRRGLDTLALSEVIMSGIASNCSISASTLSAATLVLFCLDMVVESCTVSRPGHEPGTSIDMISSGFSPLPDNLCLPRVIH
jgi:hypothetical protein